MCCVIASTDTNLFYFYLYINCLPQHNNFPLIYSSIHPNQRIRQENCCLTATNATRLKINTLTPFRLCVGQVSWVAGEKIFEKKLIFFLVVTKKAVPLQSQLGIVLWCNGSTSDSGSACEGSNPSRTTSKSDPSTRSLFV